MQVMPASGILRSNPRLVRGADSTVHGHARFGLGLRAYVHVTTKKHATRNELNDDSIVRRYVAEQKDPMNYDSCLTALHLTLMSYQSCNRRLRLGSGLIAVARAYNGALFSR